MKLLTLRDYIRSLHKRWMVKPRWPIDKKFAALRALDPETCMPEDISAITKCHSYFPTCTHCGQRADEAVEVEEGEEYERDQVLLCKNCLTQALNLFPKP